MQKILHKASNRGVGEHGWLSTRYSFSFNDWYEPTRMGFGLLRVLNDDRIAPAQGFGQHGHRDMEIITIVTKGTVTHTDNMGNIGVVPAGDVQVMSAGMGVIHAEENKSLTEELTLFQLWIEPKKKGIAPRYAQAPFGFTDSEPGITLLVQSEEDSRDEKALKINQDARISYANLVQGPAEYTLSSSGHGVYIFVIEGEVEVAGDTIKNRDAIGVWDTPSVGMVAAHPTKVLIIEVPME